MTAVSWTANLIPVVPGSTLQFLRGASSFAAQMRPAPFTPVTLHDMRRMFITELLPFRVRCAHFWLFRMHDASEKSVIWE